MNTKTKNLLSVPVKHDVHIMLIILLAIVMIAGIWIWFGHKQSQIESRIYKTTQQITISNGEYETPAEGAGYHTYSKDDDAFYINYYRYTASGR